MSEVPADAAELLRGGSTDVSVHEALGYSRARVARFRRALNIPPTPKNQKRATAAQQAWNQGQNKPRVSAPRPVGHDCPNKECGALAVGRKPVGMVPVRVPGSREPARWYTTGCAGYGQALAEVRAIPLSAPALP